MNRKIIQPEIGEQYLSGMSVADIARKFKMSRDQVDRRLFNLGIEKRPQSIEKKLDLNKVVSLYNSGESAAFIGDLFGTATETILKYLRSEGVEIRKSMSDSHLLKKIGRYSHKPAQMLVRSALKNGTLIRPNNCETCGKKPKPFRDGRSGINAHHNDYNKPLDVTWLCATCHRQWHLKNKPIPYIGRC